jgi:uncharacterized membrane protein
MRSAAWFSDRWRPFRSALTRARGARRPSGEFPAGRPVVAVAAGAGIGAGLMYLLDPDRGRRRRALARDQTIHYLHETADATGTAARDLRHRSVGLVARSRRRLQPVPPGGEALGDRVRARVAEVTRYSGAIGVEVREGIVTLAGPVLRQEADEVRRVVADLPGVAGVEDRLEIKEQADDLPPSVREQAQEPARWQPKPELLQQRWAPGPRLLAGAAGGGLVCYGLARRSLSGLLVGIAGAAVLARAATNLRLARLIGAGAGRRAVEVQKHLTIDAPVQAVWTLWEDYESFPRFMANVREVRKLQGGRSHWTVTGPLGTTMSWDAEETRRAPNELLAWKSLPGAAVQHAGVVRLEPVAGDRTRVEVTLSYNPVAGAAGHAVASILGADPKKRLDEDLLRMKTLLEKGRPAHDAAAPS